MSLAETIIENVGSVFPDIKDEFENYVTTVPLEPGDWAMCQQGIIGQIEEITSTKNGRTLYKGKTKDGKRWQSLKPTRI